MSRRDALAPAVKLPEKRFIQTKGPLLIQASQTGSRDAPGAQVIKLRSLRFHIGFNIAKALPPRDLPKHQGDKLGPAARLAERPTLVMLFGQGFEFMSREEFE